MELTYGLENNEKSRINYLVSFDFLFQKGFQKNVFRERKMNNLRNKWTRFEAKGIRV